MTLPLEQSMERERAKPIEEMARAIHDFNFRVKWDDCIPAYRDMLRNDAAAALDTLVSHGFITIEGLLAMKAETEAQSPNGEARSSVGKGAGE
jgi:hypothetical protein